MFIDFCEEKNIIIYFVKDDSHKLGIINRFHRTIKDKLRYYFADNGDLKWVDVIDDIIKFIMIVLIEVLDINRMK